MDSSGEMGRGNLTSLFDAAVRLAPVPMVIADRQGRLLSANHQWCQLYGTAMSAPERDAWLEAADPAVRLRLLDEMERTADTGRTAKVDVEMARPSGPRWTRWWLQRREVNGAVVLVIAVIDVHDEVAQRDDLRQLATHDDLTGLVNRRFFLESVEQALRRAERFVEAAGVLYIDLDGFKAVNDRAGHGVGDRVLTSMASRLRQSVRAADVVGRIGGDEFAVLIERLASPDDARVVARRIQDTLNGSVEVAGETWPLAASVGLAVAKNGHESATELLARADEDMYLVKRSHTTASAVAKPPTAELVEPSHPAELPVSPPAPPPAASRTSELELSLLEVRSLREGMDTLKHSLEALLEDLQQPPGRPPGQARLTGQPD